MVAGIMVILSGSFISPSVALSIALGAPGGGLTWLVEARLKTSQSKFIGGSSLHNIVHTTTASGPFEMYLERAGHG